MKTFKIDGEIVKVDDALYSIIRLTGFSCVKRVDDRPCFCHGDVEVPLLQLCAPAYEGKMILPRDKSWWNCTAENAVYSMTTRTKAGGASSNYRGVCFVTSTGKFRADLRHPDGSNIYLGQHPTDVEAARAFDAEAWKHYGSYIDLNFPEEHIC